MAGKTFAIMGATGQIGAVLTEQLLKKGNRVHAIGRDTHKLQNLKEKGAKSFKVDFEDSTALANAFTDCDAVFSFLPPAVETDDYGAYQDKVGEAIKQALIKAKVSFVVNLSSIGGQLKEGTGPIKGLHRHEKRLDSIPNLNVLHLRPGFFMENFSRSMSSIKNFGAISFPIRADLPIQMVATRDIGFKAAEFFDRLDFKGHTIFDFIGPKSITMQEATKAIGGAIGKKDLKYHQLTFSEAEHGMLEAGMNRNTVNLMIEMYKAFNEEKIATTQSITSEHKGKTTIEEFAATTFAHAILSSARR